MIRSSIDSEVSLTISSANILLKALYLPFFNGALTLALLFLFAFCFVVFLENIYSISNKLNTYLFFEFILLTALREGFFFT